jgi:hypothetical protein
MTVAMVMMPIVPMGEMIGVMARYRSMMVKGKMSWMAAAVEIVETAWMPAAIGMSVEMAAAKMAAAPMAGKGWRKRRRCEDGSRYKSRQGQTLQHDDLLQVLKFRARRSMTNIHPVSAIFALSVR